MTRQRCINFGKCPTADARCILRLPGRTPTCPSCRQTLTPARIADAWLVAATIGSVLIIGVCLFYARSHEQASDPASGFREFTQALRSSASGSANLREPAGTGLRTPSVKFFADPAINHLTEAALIGNKDKVRAIIAAGANVNARGIDGLTPLHVAVLNFDARAFRILLEAGANPNATTDSGSPVLSLAVLLRDTSCLDAALRAEAQTDVRDRSQQTPLMLAADHARTEAVRMLLDRGADANARDTQGNTPLIHAFQTPKPNPEIIRALLAAGARLNDANSAGLTAADYATVFPNAETLHAALR